MTKLFGIDGSIVAPMALMTGLALGALAMPTHAQNSARGESLARVPVLIPHAVEAAGIVMLEIAIARMRSPMPRNAGGIVWLAGMEVGRFSVTSARREQRYQFNVGSMVHQLGLAGGIAHVEVAVINRNGGGVPAGSALMVSNAHIVIR